MKNDGPFLFVGSHHPQRHAERLEPSEIANPGADAIIPGQLSSLADSALDAAIGSTGRFLEVVVIDATGQRAGSPGVWLASCQPRFKSPPSLANQFLPGRLGLGHFRLGRSHRLFLLVVGQQQGGRGNRTREVGIDSRFVDVVEEGEELVVLLLGNRVELVLVTSGTFECQTQECHREGVVAVGNVLDTEFLQRATALDLLRMQTVESRGQPRVISRLGHQVTGQLQGDKTVVGHVGIECPDNPVSIRPDMAIAIDLVTVRVGVASNIEPFGGHSFAIGR